MRTGGDAVDVGGHDGGGVGNVRQGLDLGAGQAGVVLYMLHMPTTPGNAHTNYTPTPPTFRLGVKGSGRRMLRGKALRMRLRI